MTFIGAAAAFVVSAPLVTRDRAKLRDIAAPMAVGALLGALGGLIAIAIAAAIYVVQRSPGRQPAMIDRLVPRYANSCARFSPSGRSALSLIENRRLRITARRDQDDNAAEPGGDADARIPTGIEILPWRTSLAVATLAVLMTGMFI